MSKQEIVNYVMNTPHNINPAILNQKLDEMEVQSDWNQNDPTAPDYIKNRPFYEVVEYPMLTCNLEKGFSNNLVNPDPNFLASLYANAPKATYIVNGVECQYNQQFGNGTSWFSIRVIGTDGVEYVIGWYNTDGLYASQLSDMTNYRLSATITVPSVNLEAVTVKLDPKYLPDVGGSEIIWLTYSNNGKLFHGFFSTETEVTYADIADLLSAFRAGTKIKVMYGETEEPNSYGWYVADVIAVYYAEDSEGTFGGLTFFGATIFADNGIVRHKLRG